ncbi:MAG: FG-GAP-like repeat-containing protein [Cyanobacteria bacterium J06614_10]
MVTNERAFAPPTNNNYVEQSGSNNPFNDFTQNFSDAVLRPALVDVDEDGDLDVVFGIDDGTIKYYENTTSGYVEQLGSNNPFNGIDTDWNASPAFADLDDDGDLDLMIGEGGESSGKLTYFRKIGSSYVEQTGNSDPFRNLDPIDGANPTFVDIDDDGDFDVVSGYGYGTLIIYNNEGTKTSPLYSEITSTGSENLFFDLGNHSNGAPAFVDIDNDGDLDAFVGESYRQITYYKNTGSASNPEYTYQSGSNNPLDNIGSNIFAMTPMFADIDGDSDLDVVVGDGYGTFNYYENPASGPKLTPSSEDDAVEVTNFGDGYNALELLLDAVGVDGVSEIVVLVGDSSDGSDAQEVARFSLLAGGGLGADYAPTLLLDDGLVEEGQFLQLQLVENGETRSSSIVARGDDEIAFDFGGGTVLTLQLAHSDGMANMMVGDGDAIDFSDYDDDVVMNLEFSVFREAAYNNTLGFYTTDDADGGILVQNELVEEDFASERRLIRDEVTGTMLRPGDEGYREAALARRLDTTLTGENGRVQSFSAEMAGGNYVGMFLIADGSDLDSENIYFSHSDANENGHDHMIRLGSNTFGVEDMAGLGDRDYNDIVVSFSATPDFTVVPS